MTADEPSRADHIRERILEAARRVLVEEGNAGFSMRKVASAADMRLGHLQYYFSSKAELVRALVASITDSFDSFYSQRLMRVEDPLDRFIGSAEFVLYGGPIRDMGLLLRECWSMAPRDHDVAEAMDLFYEGWCARLAEALQAVNPDLLDPQARLLGAEVVAMISGSFLFTEGFSKLDQPGLYVQHLRARLTATPWMESA